MGPTVLFLPDYGDANPYQPQLARALGNHGVSVSMASGTGPFPLLAAFVAHGRPPVVHLHWLHPYVVGRGPVTTGLKGGRFIVELLVLRLLGVKLVWTVHNLLEHDRRAPEVETAVKRVVFRLVDAGIVHCESARQAVGKTFRLPRRHRSKLTVVPHGHYTDWYPNDRSKGTARRSLGLRDAGTVFLYFGRIHPYKNVLGLVEAFKSLAAERARLMIVGRPRDTSLAATIAHASDVDPRIRLQFDYVPDDAVQRYVNAADVVVLPYRDVLTSGSAVLAASFRRAIIAPRCGCIADRFDDASGLIYDPVADGLERALERALSVDLDRIGRRNYARVREPDWGAIAAATAVVYDTGPGTESRASRVAGLY